MASQPPPDTKRPSKIGTTERRTDTLIIGAGVIGLSLAWELSKRGMRVVIADAGTTRSSSSWAGAGILPPAATRNVIDPYEQLKSLSHSTHALWADELKRQTGIDNGYQECGGLCLARSRAEQATLWANEIWWEQHGIAYQRLSPSDVAALEPNLSELCESELLGACFLPGEGQLRNPHHLQALKAACRANGVIFHDGYTITELRQTASKIEGVRNSDGSYLQADHYCICSGAWARELLERLCLPSGIMPVRGQMVLYHCGRPPFSHVINEGNRYLVPRLDGRLLAGSVEEEVGYVCETTNESLGQIRRWAEAIYPALRETSIEHAWAGLRPGSFDGFPYLGNVPGTDNLFLAAGHFRSGLHLSCGTALVMADLITGKQPTIDLWPFRIGRG